jgi:nitrogen fixation protein FixH
MKLAMSLLSMLLVSNAYSAPMQIEAKDLAKYVQAAVMEKAKNIYTCEVYSDGLVDAFLPHVNAGFINDNHSITLTYDGPDSTSQKIDFTITPAKNTKSIDHIKVDFYNYRQVNVGDLLNPVFEVQLKLMSTDICRILN